ncbi:hypothetical protein [Acidocella sp. KAb 2-4]|uniref:hypothetical protein n=1 Tax=Acidocella sp. KAb 2-4 TaxID=2885158 RepID=UPI001D082CB3|nr:hypothetical protein [Acidocella sp. KAb 2-4]MCB5944126.1 hypothetical protein [Acidocella sp. KAb 2-4]
MSGTVAAGFTDAQKAEIRRYCGYPAYGAGAAGFSSWRFFQAYGTLEYRLNNLAPAESAVALQYVTTLGTIEAAIPRISDNLDTESAAAWTHNANELKDREALFDSWRRRLCGFLGVPPGPALGQAGVTLVV